MPTIIPGRRIVAALATPFSALALALALAFAAGPALAQDRDVPEIVVTPSGPGGTGSYGAYGRDLPGVYMLSGSGLPVTPDVDDGRVPLPGNAIISQRYTYQQPLPTLDAWHGTQGPGVFRF